MHFAYINVICTASGQRFEVKFAEQIYREKLESESWKRITIRTEVVVSVILELLKRARLHGLITHTDTHTPGKKRVRRGDLRPTTSRFNSNGIHAKKAREKKEIIKYAKIELQKHTTQNEPRLRATQTRSK